MCRQFHPFSSGAFSGSSFLEANIWIPNFPEDVHGHISCSGGTLFRRGRCRSVRSVDFSIIAFLVCLECIEDVFCYALLAGLVRECPQIIGVGYESEFDQNGRHSTLPEYDEIGLFDATVVRYRA